MREIIKPTIVTSEMVKIALGGFKHIISYHHVAGNLNAMLKYGYCSVCHLVPKGCEREGCLSIKGDTDIYSKIKSLKKDEKENIKNGKIEVYETSLLDEIV